MRRHASLPARRNGELAEALLGEVVTGTRRCDQPRLRPNQPKGVVTTIEPDADSGPAPAATATAAASGTTGMLAVGWI